MIEFFKAYGGTVLVVAILAAIVVAIVANMIKNKKQGKSSCGCGCGCSGCPSQGICHTDGNEK